jgi:hypothetical protein
VNVSHKVTEDRNEGEHTIAKSRREHYREMLLKFYEILANTREEESQKHAKETEIVDHR